VTDTTTDHGIPERDETTEDDMTTTELTPTPAAPAAPATGGKAPADYRLTDVTKIYKRNGKEVRALASVTLEIPAGQMVAIQGPTGGGKSTLLQMLGALDRPSSGTVVLGERDLSKASDGRLAEVRGSDIGFVFQSFNLIPTLTARENVEAAFATGAVPSAERRARSIAALESVGLGDRLDHRPAELSGGQQQRVAIARALVKEPRVLLADEPTGALDETTRDEIMALLQATQRERGITLVIVTHDSSVAKLAERRLRIKQGVVSEG
jgi:putative ABC transport system ATP-binding protein